MNDPETLRLFEAHRKAEAARDYDAIRATFTEACFSETVTARAAKTRQRRTRAAYEALFTALPDPSHNDQGRALGDDVVVVWGHFARTNDGDWLGVPPAADPCRAVCRRRALQGRRDTRRDDLAPPRTLCDRPGSTSTRFGRPPRPGAASRDTGERPSSATGKAVLLCPRATPDAQAHSRAATGAGLRGLHYCEHGRARPRRVSRRTNSRTRTGAGSLSSRFRRGRDRYLQTEAPNPASGVRAAADAPAPFARRRMVRTAHLGDGFGYPYLSSTWRPHRPAARACHASDHADRPSDQ
jgi:hypothetical protein